MSGCSPAYVSDVYARFMKYCADNGYSKNPPEELPLGFTKSWDVQGGVAGVDTGAPAKKQILDGTSSDEVVRTTDPTIAKGNNLAGETLIVIYGVRVHFDPANYAGTLVETREVQEALNKSRLVLRAGSDRVFDLRGRSFMDYGPGLGVGHDGANGAAASVPSRFIAQQADKVHLLADARIIGPTQQLDLQHWISKAAWTTDNDFDCVYDLLGFVGRKA